MRLLLALVLCTVCFSPLSSAETLDKSKFTAPGSSKTDLKAPVNDALKAPGVPNPAQGPSGPGGGAPIAPTNGVCPANYHCNVSSSAPRCFPNRYNFEISGPDRCSNVTRLCDIYRKDIASGGKLDESDAQKFAYYCN